MAEAGVEAVAAGEAAEAAEAEAEGERSDAAGGDALREKVRPPALLPRVSRSPSPKSPMSPGGRLKAAETTYSQALSMARAQAAVRMARGGPKSPRKKKEALELLAYASWYHPGKSRLKEVNPRMVLRRRSELMDSASGKSKFTSGRAEPTVHKVMENGMQRKLFYNLDSHSPILFSCGHARVERPPSEPSEEETESDDLLEEEEEERRDEDDDALEERRRRSIYAGAGGKQLLASSAVEKFLKRGRPEGGCDPQNHTTFLRDQVYRVRCDELKLKENSAVRNMLCTCLKAKVCYCSLSEVSFAGFAIGDRGLSGLLPLLTFGRRVKCLNLANNDLRSDAVRQLCALLCDPLVLSTLLVLDLSHNPVGYACTEELQRLLRQRPQILMLGLYGSQLRPPWRQRLLRQSLANFGASERAAMDQAMRYSERPGAFYDLDLRIRCEPLLTEAMNRPISPRAGKRSQTPSSETRSRPASRLSQFLSPSPPPPEDEGGQDSPGSLTGDGS